MVDFSFIVSLYVSDLPNVTIVWGVFPGFSRISNPSGAPFQRRDWGAYAGFSQDFSYE